MRLLVVNAGSSSLKLSVVEAGDRVGARQELGRPGDQVSLAGLRAFVAGAGSVDAVGHRIVHGGPDVVEAAVVDDAIRERLNAGAQIDPLHVPAALAILDRLRGEMAVPQIVCLDTAFHAAMPEAARTYAIPAAWRALGVRRFGFHGLSFAWSLRRAAEQLGVAAADLQVVVAHLGAGSSVCAIRDGHGVDTSMGFTPVEGLVMATRSGSVDPGALTWLQTAHGITAAEMNDALERHSGLQGVAGTGDMRAVLAAAARGGAEAVLARDVWVHRAAREIAAMTASLERLDALVFTGGIGENSAEIRTAILAQLGALGLGPGHTRAARNGRVAVLVVPAREELEMAQQMRDLLA
ncbi:MAG: acetate/propionate family kinase [Candidatus Dormibacteria bacterium]